jgi:hypothetical protein
VRRATGCVDLIVERCRRVREELIQQYGGLEGLFRKLEAMDREREKTRTARLGKSNRTAGGRPTKRRAAKKP